MPDNIVAMSESILKRTEGLPESALHFYNEIVEDFASYLDTFEDTIRSCRERSLIKTKMEEMLDSLHSALLVGGMK